MSKNIVVTGGAGFIGSNLVNRLQKIDPKSNITVVDNFSTGSKLNLKLFKGKIINKDINNLDLDKYFNKVDQIYHQAAITDTTIMDENLMIKTNFESFKNILNFSLDNNIKLVYASSAATYGNSNPPMRVGFGEKPTNIYGISKLKCDNLVRNILNNKDSQVVGLRYFNVYGPNEKYKGKMSSMIWQLFNQIKEKKNPKIFKYGEQKRDFVYVSDVVNANISAMNGVPGIYNVGTGKSETFNKIIKIINNKIGSKNLTEYIDNPYEFYQENTCADLRNSRFIDYSPKFNLENGINHYLDRLI